MCVNGEQIPGSPKTCVLCESKRDYWAKSLENNFSDKQMCEHMETIGSKLPEEVFQVDKYFWAIALVAIVIIICAV